MVYILKMPAGAKESEAWDLIGCKLSKKRRESYKKWAKKADYVVIDKKMVVWPIIVALCTIIWGRGGGNFVGC